MYAITIVQTGKGNSTYITHFLNPRLFRIFVLTIAAIAGTQGFVIYSEFKKQNIIL
jgi:hypothetical protein